MLLRRAGLTALAGLSCYMLPQHLRSSRIQMDALEQMFLRLLDKNVRTALKLHTELTGNLMRFILTALFANDVINRSNSDKQ